MTLQPVDIKSFRPARIRRASRTVTSTIRWMLIEEVLPHWLQHFPCSKTHGANTVPTKGKMGNLRVYGMKTWSVPRHVYMHGTHAYMFIYAYGWHFLHRCRSSSGGPDNTSVPRRKMGSQQILKLDNLCTGISAWATLKATQREGPFVKTNLWKLACFV